MHHHIPGSGKRVGFAWLLLLGTVLVGCGDSTARVEETAVAESALPVVSGAAIDGLVATNDRPMLVEFGVDYGCDRCRDMKPDLLELAEKYEHSVDVVRVDFNANAAMVARFGGTICPTYVLFDEGKMVQVRSFPTSLGQLESDLVSRLPLTADGPPPDQSHSEE